MIVASRYHLPKSVTENLRGRPVEWGFGLLSEAAYRRSYAREGEEWADTVIRVVEGVMSIRKDWLTRSVGVAWDESYWTGEAAALADAIFMMRLLPPGRGLWAMGTEFVYDRGSHALNNCAFVSVEQSLSKAAAWLMDSLMCGVGVGFDTHKGSYSINPTNGEAVTFVVPDSREGWAESVRRLVASYEHGSRPVRFDYSEVRKAGSPIRGFGGVSGGPKPLKDLHARLRLIFESALAVRRSLGWRARVTADVMNAIGCCVVAGNVRRSAEIALGSIDNNEFLHLKDYDLNPDRKDIGWMSNNSVALDSADQFERLPWLAPLIADNGEPGLLNLVNVHKYGRTGDRMHDDASGINPCGEIPLESYELCNLVEVFPTRCGGSIQLAETARLATMYSSTVSLLRSHSPETNEVVARNRRIGVSVTGIADWIDSSSVSNVFGTLNRIYEQVVRPENARLAAEAGVPASIRVTTVKPSGTVSLLAGVSSGVHWPTAGHVLRRMRVASGSSVSDKLRAAGVPNEPDVYSDETDVFEFPVRYGKGRTRSVKRVSVYEQAAVVAMLQKCWADNAVSNTLTFQPHETDQVERVLAMFAPQVKSLSLLPDREGVYDQMPLEQITKDEFERRSGEIGEADWAGTLEDATPDRYCENDVCEVPR